MNRPALHLVVPDQPLDEEALAAELAEARSFMRAAAAALPEARWGERPSPAYSPVGWHVGHAATTLGRWMLPDGARPPEALARLFDPLATPKDARDELPAPATLLSWLDEVHERVEAELRQGRIARAPQAERAGLPQTYLVHFFAQHELQHGEHAAVVAALLQERLWRAGARPLAPSAPHATGRVFLDGGPVIIGSHDAAEIYDNERRPEHLVLAPYWIDRAPVTVRAFADFVAAGGYQEPRLWTEEGFAWRCRNNALAPLGWLPCGGRQRFLHPDGDEALDLPVTGLSWFEADAFARFRGARLPTEAEWENAAGPAIFPTGARPTAASANVDGARLGLTPVASFAPSPRGLFDLAGNVWEWTSSWFRPYPGFQAYPYDGYSTPWFGQSHRVLRGGSFATAGRLCRRSFRNFYEPGFRELPAGLRCAGDAP